MRKWHKKDWYVFVRVVCVCTGLSEGALAESISISISIYILATQSLENVAFPGAPYIYIYIVYWIEREKEESKEGATLYTLYISKWG